MYEANSASDAVNARIGTIWSAQSGAMGALMAGLLTSIAINGDTDSVALDYEHHLRMYEAMGGAETEHKWREWIGEAEAVEHFTFRPPSSELPPRHETEMRTALENEDIAAFCVAFREAVTKLELGCYGPFTVVTSKNPENSVYVQWISDFRNLDYDLSIMDCLTAVTVGGVPHDSKSAEALLQLGMQPDLEYDHPGGYRCLSLESQRSSAIISYSNGAITCTPPSDIPEDRTLAPLELFESDVIDVWWLVHMIDTAGLVDGWPLVYTVG